MNTCGSCKYWGRPTAGRFGTCRAVIHDGSDATSDEEYITPIEERDWLPEKRRRELIVIRDTAKAVVKDGSGYFAALRCAEDFGCVLHEPKG